MITLTKAMFDEMVAHAEAELPNEACGVVAGADGAAVRIYPMKNAEQSPIVYRFDEKEQLEVFGEIEQKGWDLMAFFHSHTHTEAYPSPTDRANAHWQDPTTGEQVPSYPGTAYLILSLEHPTERVLRAFRFENGEPVEQELRVE
ncbi:MAG: Mov34/MPN/PAD-1 family protein [Actinomycetota bacterium]